MLSDLALTIGGLVVLVLGADYLIRGAVSLARRLGISPMVIGLTVVALGTSLPELVVSGRAALDGATGLAVGNVVGSNIANILLILGATALIAPIGCSRSAVLRDGTIMVAATGLFVAAGVAGTLTQWHGIVALLLLAGYLYLSYHLDQRDDGRFAHEVEEIPPVRGGMWLTALAVTAGLIGVVLGAELLVNGAVGLARTLGVAEEVIGLTLVAFGTSVPELATAVVAAFRRHGDVALGNVLGSNLFNTLGILGVVALLVPFEVPDRIMHFDLWFMAVVSLLLLPLMRSGWRLCRPEGLFFVVLYVLFLAAQYFDAGDAMMALAKL